MKRLIGIETGSFTFDASAQTITFSGIGTIALEQILLITNITDNVVIYQFNKPGKGGTYVPSTGVLTLAYNTTTMDDADSLQVLIDLDSNGYDKDLDGIKIIDQTNAKTGLRTDVESLLSAAQAFTTSFVDCGPEVDGNGYNWAKFWFTLDINQGSNARIKFLQKHTYAGSEEYPIAMDKIECSAPFTYYETIGGVNAQYIEIDTDIDQLFCVTIQLDNTMPFIQCQIQIGVDGGTDAEIDALYVTKGY